MRISQSLIKETRKNDHCPKQVYYSFVEGKDLIEPSEAMLLGRYFESELLGACRGGVKQEPNYLKSGGKAKPFADCDQLVVFARDVFKKLGLNIEEGESQLEVKTELLKASIDHRNKDIKDPLRMANYDVKWTATKEDDRWNGWGDPESKEDAIIQAAHYTLVSFEETGEWMPFYFLVFGKNKWVKVLQYIFDDSSIEAHRERIRYTGYAMKEHQHTGFKGNGNYNKCLACPFYEQCPDKATVIEIESIYI